MAENIVYVNKETLEIEAMRTEFSKTYYVTDTERKLVSSRSPIHIQDKNGKWVDITCEVKGRKVINCPYEAKLLPNKIGYQVKREDQLIEMEIIDIPYVKPTIQNNVAVWENITKGVDVAITFTSNGAQISRVIKNKSASASFNYRIVGPESIFEHLEFNGYDSENNITHLEQKEKSTKNITRMGKKLVEKVIANKFLKEVVNIDPKTRKRFWSKDVKYPVVIN